jgi:hypothetical protein
VNGDHCMLHREKKIFESDQKIHLATRKTVLKFLSINLTEKLRILENGIF